MSKAVRSKLKRKRTEANIASFPEDDPPNPALSSTSRTGRVQYPLDLLSYNDKGIIAPTKENLAIIYPHILDSDPSGMVTYWGKEGNFVLDHNTVIQNFGYKYKYNAAIRNKDYAKHLTYTLYDFRKRSIYKDEAGNPITVTFDHDITILTTIAECPFMIRIHDIALKLLGESITGNITSDRQPDYFLKYLQEWYVLFASEILHEEHEVEPKECGNIWFIYKSSGVDLNLTPNIKRCLNSGIDTLTRRVKTIHFLCTMATNRKIEEVSKMMQEEYEYSDNYDQDTRLDLELVIKKSLALMKSTLASEENGSLRFNGDNQDLLDDSSVSVYKVTDIASEINSISNLHYHAILAITYITANDAYLNIYFDVLREMLKLGTGDIIKYVNIKYVKDYNGTIKDYIKKDSVGVVDIEQDTYV